MVTLRLRHAFLLFTCFATCRLAAARLPQKEVDGLSLVMEKMGSSLWEFDADTCRVGRVVMTPQPPQESDATITCSILEDNTSHVVAMVIKGFSLPGILPPELVQLPYLQTIDFAYNFLSGSIPAQWASLPLTSISVLVNRLSGEIPKELGNFTNLTELNLEANKFSGRVPPELGKLLNLESLLLSSNNLSGNLPSELADLKNLTDFRINDNNFNGTIPDFIQNWKQLTRLEMHASGLEGPIPSSISVLGKLKQLRISDINGRNQTFPDLSNMTAITRMVLRNCNIHGDIPGYIWGFKPLRVLDLSFNKLIGEIPDVKITENIKFVYLSGNMLSGKIPRSILMPGTNVDLSYNNFSWQGPEQPACTQSMNLMLNLYRSSSMENNIKGVSPCIQDLKCHRYWHSLYVDCGGKSVKIKGNKGDIHYEGDANVGGGASTLHLSEETNWGFSSTGDFMDDNNFQNAHYIATSQNASELLYTSARIAPISLTYYRYCLENGSYNVSLHFAEIQFTNDETYSSLGRRVFDIYIQNTLVENDFNIEAEAPGVAKPVIKPYNANVTNHILEIRLQWAGKGTTRIPDRSVYGPLISAISVEPNFKPRSEDGEKRVELIIVGVVGSCLIFFALGIFWWRRYMREKNGREKDLGGLELQTGSFTLKQIKAATKNFDPVNKIGEGGFGSVFKGLLPDGTVIAVKQLSSKSNQGNREFLNEIGMISCLQHPNLVKLYGCCIEGDQMLVVYEYMENNSLARALFGPENCQPKLDWPTRHKICVGIARGLAFIHEESRLKIVHRDIKGTNVLLDEDLNPKISDFGLAKLHEEEKTHISTRIAGTIGYMAPEYALWGYLTNKADVYSFGVVALEIASGKHNMSYGPENNCACLLDWACQLQESGNLMELVDEKLESEFNKVEAERMIKVALICTNASPSLRPTMSEVVSMLEGTTIIPEVIPEASTYSQDLRFVALRDHHKQLRNQSLRESQSHNSTSAHDLYSINEETYLAMRGDYVKPESQLSTSVPSWVASSSTSARDLYSIITSKSPR